MPKPSEPKAAAQKVAAPMTAPIKPSRISSDATSPLRPSRMSKGAIGLVPPSPVAKQKTRVAEPAESPSLRKSRIADTKGALTSPLRESRLASKVEMPSPPRIGSDRMRMLGQMPEAPSRIADKRPMIHGSDPVVAMAATRQARMDMEAAVEERRQPSGIQGSMTYSQLVG